VAPRYNSRKLWAMVATYGVLFFAICVILFPIFWMFSSSFKGQTELFARDMTLLPRVWSWENYVNVWSNTPFPKYFWNSFYIAVITTLITVAFAIYAAYAIARLRFRGRFLIGMVLLVTQMFPHVTLVLPLFLIIRNIGLFDTHAALIIAQVAFSLPFAVWMLRGFFVSIPAELEDAAAVDGAGLMTTLHKIIVPLAGPGIAAVAMFTFIRSWNEFLFALVLLQSQSLRTLPLGLASFQEEYTYRWDLMMAGGSIISLPVLFFFILMQRFIVQGLLGGALKG
jgi:ABC-type glycerol-3-phosphate transport system permease component